MTRNVLSLLCAGALACSLAMAENARPVPQITRRLDVDFCLAVSRGKAAADESRCPAFITEQLPELDSECREFKGTLQGGADAEISSLDIDGDGSDEYLFVLDGAFMCSTAASLFGCGSSPCPDVMFRRDASDGKWHELGYFPVGARFAAVARADDTRHPDLRIHCESTDVCDPALYRWQVQASPRQPPYYREIERTLRGVTVTMLQGGKLLVIPHKVPIYTAPHAHAAVLYESESGAYFVIFGEVKGTDFVAASPCHACEPGFVRRADLGL